MFLHINTASDISKKTTKQMLRIVDIPAQWQFHEQIRAEVDGFLFMLAYVGLLRISILAYIQEDGRKERKTEKEKRMDSNLATYKTVTNCKCIEFNKSST